MIDDKKFQYYKEDLDNTMAEAKNIAEATAEARSLWGKTQSGSEEEKQAQIEWDARKEKQNTIREELRFVSKRILQVVGLDCLIPYLCYTRPSMEMDFKLLQNLADKAGLHYKSFSDQNTILIAYDGEGNNLPADMRLLFSIEMPWLKTLVSLDDTQLEGWREKPIGRNMLDLCNEYNRTTRFFKAYVDDDGQIMLERQDYIGEDVTEEMVEKIIDAVPAAAGKFFEENSELFKAIISSKKLSIVQ